jgi:arabinose-5-phosphate isomerase
MSANHLVKDRMLDLKNFPILSVDATLKKALDAMTELRLGVACFVDSNNILKGLLTDGDLRRLILTKQSPLPALLVSRAVEFGTTAPSTILPEESIDVAASRMNEKHIWDLPVVDANGQLLGLVHRHDVI